MLCCMRRDSEMIHTCVVAMASSIGRGSELQEEERRVKAKDGGTDGPLCG